MSSFLAGAVLAVATAAIILILVMTASGRKRSGSGSTREQAGDSASAGPFGNVAANGRRWPCPLCGALLGSGERIRSIIRFSPTHGRVMEISGCPKCLPPASRRRACPVCRADLGPQDFLMASVFDRSTQGAKPHVHVLGCSRCRA